MSYATVRNENAGYGERVRTYHILCLKSLLWQLFSWNIGGGGTAGERERRKLGKGIYFMAQRRYNSVCLYRSA